MNREAIIVLLVTVAWFGCVLAACLLARANKGATDANEEETP